MNEQHLTREQLYEAVWQTPISHLAKQYGVQSYVLTNICDQFEIPRPGPDYWPCRRLGYEMERTSLPPAPIETPEIIRISTRTKHPETKPAELPANASEEDSYIAEDTQRAQVMIAHDFRRAHPLVRRARLLLANADPSQDGFLRAGWKEMCPNVIVTKSQLQRALLILDAVLRELDKRGYNTNVIEQNGREETCVQVEAEQVRIRITEKTIRIETEGTEEEKKGLWWNRYSYKPSGILIFTIDEYHGPRQRNWSDGKSVRVEDRLVEIVEAICQTGEALRLHRIQQAEEEKRRQEEERIRCEMERRREEDEARQLSLERQAARWHASERLREFIRVCHHALANRMDMSADSPTCRWLDWASLHADRIDPLRNGNIESAIASLPPDSMRVLRNEPPSLTPPSVPA